MEKEGIYLGGKKDFLAPPIFDIDSVSNYDLDNQTVEGYPYLSKWHLKKYRKC